MSKLKMPPKGQSAAMMAALQAEHASPVEENSPETNVATLEVSPPQLGASAPAEPPSEAARAREDRFALAMGRATEEEIAVVTVRVPASLNRYMDEYVARVNHTNRRARYRKQDAVAEAFAAFYADHVMPALTGDDELG
jgi:hypothetical protein